MPCLIELRDLSKNFRDITQKDVMALKDISMDAQKGDFVCIMGPSGCGKTTLLHIIAGLKPYFPPNRGAIYLEVQKIKGQGAERGT